MRVQPSFPIKALHSETFFFFYFSNVIALHFCIVVAHIINKHYVMSILCYYYFSNCAYIFAFIFILPLLSLRWLFCLIFFFHYFPISLPPFPRLLSPPLPSPLFVQSFQAIPICSKLNKINEKTQSVKIGELLRVITSPDNADKFLYFFFVFFKSGNN